jgi:hypothetical protein
VAYPVGALLQGPVADHVGVAWTTAGSAGVLGVVCLVTAWRWPAFVRAVAAGDPAPAARPAAAEPAPVGEPAAECG